MLCEEMLSTDLHVIDASTSSGKIVVGYASLLHVGCRLHGHAIPEVSGAVVHPMVQKVASMAVGHFSKHPPHVGLEDVITSTPAAGPPGLVPTLMTSASEQGAAAEADGKESPPRA